MISDYDRKSSGTKKINEVEHWLIKVEYFKRDGVSPFWVLIKGKPF
jgi:hypothetical protein